MPGTAGWLTFRLPPAEVAVHPVHSRESHELFLVCDDIQATVEQLAAKTVELSRPVSDEGWGLLTAVRLPGGGELGLRAPHPRATGL